MATRHSVLYVGVGGGGYKRAYIIKIVNVMFNIYCIKSVNSRHEAPINLYCIMTESGSEGGFGV